MTAQPDPVWYPDPPMALELEWATWRELAIAWMVRQSEPFTADELKLAMPPAERPNFPGAAIHTARSRGLIETTGTVRRSTSKTRKGSLLPFWRAT